MTQQMRTRVGMPTSLYGSGGVLTTAANGELYQPHFDDRYTVFRIVPAPNLDNPQQIEPWRIDQSVFGQWHCPLYTVKSIGFDRNATETWVVHNGLSDGSFNPRSNPVVKVRNAIKSAKEKGSERPGWAILTEGKAGQSEALPSPSIRSLVRTLIPFHDRKPRVPMLGSPQTGALAYFLIPQRAWDAMTSAMSERIEGTRPDPSQPQAGYKVGDPIDPRRGVWWVIHKDGVDPRVPMGQARENKDARGHGCYYETLWANQPAVIADHDMERLLAMMRPWEECVQVVTEEDQVRRLARLFNPVIGLIVHALDNEYGHLFTAEQRQAGLAQLGHGPTIQTGMPAHGYPPQGMHVQQPPFQPQPYPQVAQAIGFQPQVQGGYPGGGYPQPVAPHPTAGGYPGGGYTAPPIGFQPAPAAGYPGGGYPQPQAAPAYPGGGYPQQPPPAAGYPGIGQATPQPATPPFEGDPFVQDQVQAAMAQPAEGGGYPASPAYPASAPGGPGQPPAGAYPGLTTSGGPQAALDALANARRMVEQHQQSQQSQRPAG